MLRVKVSEPKLGHPCEGCSRGVNVPTRAVVLVLAGASGSRVVRFVLCVNCRLDLTTKLETYT